MARFTLTILPDGRAMLATSDPIATEQIAAIEAAFRRWTTAQPPEALIVGDCDVVRVTEVELDVAEVAG